MSNQAEIARLIDALGAYRTRAAARKQLAAFGTEAAAQLTAILADSQRPENMRWAAISLVAACAHLPACPALVEVARSYGGLRGTAVEALETITGLRIGDDLDEWDKALADPEGYQTTLERAGSENDESTESEVAACEIFRQGLAGIAAEFTWEDEGYLHMRIPLEGGRKQQIIVTFGEVTRTGQPLTTIYTECGEPTPEILADISRRNVTIKYGSFLIEQEEGQPAKVIMRETVPLHRLTPELAREIVQAIAAEADLLEFELTGVDRI